MPRALHPSTWLDICHLETVNIVSKIDWSWFSVTWLHLSWASLTVDASLTDIGLNKSRSLFWLLKWYFTAFKGSSLPAAWAWEELPDLVYHCTWCTASQTWWSSPHSACSSTDNTMLLTSKHYWGLVLEPGCQQTTKFTILGNYNYNSQGNITWNTL